MKGLVELNFSVEAASPLFMRLSRPSRTKLVVINDKPIRNGWLFYFGEGNKKYISQHNQLPIGLECSIDESFDFEQSSFPGLSFVQLNLS